MAESSGDTSTEGQPLQALFAKAQALFAQAEGGSEPAAKDGVGLLRRCADAVDRLALFSSNEEKDDVATPDLKYLSIPYLHGELAARGAATDMQERLASLQDSSQQYMRFLHRLQQYGLLEMTVSEAFDRLEAGERSDPTTTRSSKIAIFKMERDVKAQLQAINRRRLESRQLPELDDDEDEDGVGAVDEEAEREAWLLQLDLYAIKAVQALSATQQEVQLLQAAAAMPEAERQKAKESNAPPPELMRQLMSAASGLESQRQQIRENLLRPSHMMPTRSLAQQADIEIAQAQEAAQQQQAAEAARAAKGSDDEDDDEAVFRQRAQDDWKDEHPTGWGNSKLRPTA